MLENEIYYILSGITGGIAQLLLVVFSAFLVFKTKKTAAILMLIGSMLTLFFRILNSIWPMVASTQSLESVAKTISIINLVASIPYLIFTIGFAMFAFNHVNKRA